MAARTKALTSKAKAAKKPDKAQTKASVAQAVRSSASPKPSAHSSSRRSVLGRGLEALLTDSKHVREADASLMRKAGIEELPVAQIALNPYQPRTQFDQTALAELASSIEQHGLIQPITVRKVGREGYQLISGERRLQAIKRLERTHIPAYVRTAEDEQMLEMALVENIQREALDAIEIALSYQRLIDECKILQEDVGRRVGKDRSTVTNYLRLLRLPPDIQAALRSNRITMGHARSLLSVRDPVAQLMLFGDVVKKQHSVRQTEAAVRQLNERQKTKNKKPLVAVAVDKKEAVSLAVLRKLQDRLGTKIRLQEAKKEEGAGELRIAYYSEDDLARLVDLICS